MNKRHSIHIFIVVVGILLLIISPTITHAQRTRNEATIRILIFDEFGLPDDDLHPVDPGSIPLWEYCAATPEALSGQGKLGVITGMGDTSNISHGQVVSAIVLETLELAGGVYMGSHSVGYDVLLGNAIIRIEEVDIFNNDSITLSQIIDLIWKKVDGVYIPTVLNMSLAFVPCDLLYNATYMLDTSEIESFMFNPMATQDPFYEMMRTQQQLILVASAGNYELTYPLYPAAFPWVIGVGATDLQYFNDAEITHDANFSIPIARNQTLQGEGTSFSAPRVSATLGIYLQNGFSTRCQEGIPLNFQDTVPPELPFDIFWYEEDTLLIDSSDYCP